MKTLTVLAVLVAMAAMAQAQQGFPEPRPLYSPEDQARRQQIQLIVEARRESDRQARTRCTLPDESTHPINAVVRYEGQSYRCAEVFTPNMTGAGEVLTIRLAGWIKL